MKLLKIFNDENVSEERRNDFQQKRQVRIIIFDDNGKIALLYSKRGGYYEIPGGGIEEGEKEEESVIRECKEETGCNVEIVKEVGKTIEVREQKKVVNETYCYIAKVLGEKGKPIFQENEKEDDFVLIWTTLDEAKEKIKGNKVSENLYYNYVTARALLFLNEAI